MIVKGFKAAAVAAGLRYQERSDLGLIAADGPAAWAGVFTANICQASPVVWSRKAMSGGRGRALLANAGQANAQTGRPGDEDCRLSASGLAGLLACAPEDVALASTGVIGQRLNVTALQGALPGLAAGLRPDGLDDFARAIMTTDTFAKTASAELAVGGKPVTVWGCAKGSGMIAPNMATMLGFVLTDAAASPEILRDLLSEGADLSFNRVTVDGDTSTNDCLMFMASGASGAPAVESGEALENFRAAVFRVLKDLARQIARDGEGATRLVTIRLTGAASAGEARRAVRTVAESPLVKTAFFGADANWGRILAALGRSGARFDPYAVDLDLDDVPWVRGGLDNQRDREAAAVMKNREYTLSIDLKAGSAEYEMLTCDFSHDYVTINGSYRS